MRRLVVSLLVVVAGVAALSVPAAGDVTAFSSSAFGLLAIENDSQILFGPQPEEVLPPAGGGPFTQTETNISVAQAGIMVGELAAAVEGSGLGGHDGEVSANVVGEDFNVEDLLNAQDVLNADFDSNCSADVNGASGGTTFLDGDIIVNGSPQPLPQNPAPNTEIQSSPSVRVILNEQSVANQPGSASIRVAALHIMMLEAGSNDEIDIFAGQVECHVSGPDVLAGLGAAPPSGPALPLTDPRSSPAVPLGPADAVRTTPTFTG